MNINKSKVNHWPKHIVGYFSWWRLAMIVMLLFIWHGCTIDAVIDGDDVQIKARGRWTISIDK